MNRIPDVVITNTIASYLDEKSIINLSFSAKRYYPLLKEGRKKTFIRKVGTILSHEKVDDLIANMGITNCIRKIGPNGIISSNDHGQLQYESINEFKDRISRLSFIKRLKLKYRIYKTNYSEKVTKIRHNSFATAITLRDERYDLTKPLTPERITENRKRIPHLLEEVTQISKIILHTNKNFLKLLNCLERCIFKIIKWFDKKNNIQVTNTPYVNDLLEHWYKAYIILSPNVGFNWRFLSAIQWHLDDNNRHAIEKNITKFAETRYRFNDQDHPISVHIYTGGKRGGTMFLELKENGKTIGDISFDRNRKHPNILEIYKSEDYIGRDPATGDFPIQRLLMKIAMEIFQRENCQKLQFDHSHWKIAHILAAGGFETDNQDMQYRLLNEIQTSRNEGMLFPASQEDSDNFVMSIQKGEHVGYYSTVDPTKPALVDLVLGKPPITWEKEIEERPIFKGSGSIIQTLLDDNPYKDLANEQ